MNRPIIEPTFEGFGSCPEDHASFVFEDRHHNTGRNVFELILSSFRKPPEARAITGGEAAQLTKLMGPSYRAVQHVIPLATGGTGAEVPFLRAESQNRSNHIRRIFRLYRAAGFFDCMDERQKQLALRRQHWRFLSRYVAGAVDSWVLP